MRRQKRVQSKNMRKSLKVLLMKFEKSHFTDSEGAYDDIKSTTKAKY